MNKKKIDQNPLIQRLIELLYKIIKGIFTRIYLIPIYALIAVPWIVLLTLAPPEGMINRFAFRITAVLSGNPSAENLNETDLGRAVFMLFITYSLFAELLSVLRGKKFNSNTNKLHVFKIQAVIIIIGWAIAGSVLSVDIGIVAFLIAILFAALTTGMLYLIYLFINSLSTLNDTIKRK